MPGFATDFHQCSLFNKDLKEKTADYNPEISFQILRRKESISPEEGATPTQFINTRREREPQKLFLALFLMI